MFRFTIRELVLLTLVVAMGVGWWLDRLRLSRAENAAQQYRAREQRVIAQFQSWQDEWARVQDEVDDETKAKITAGYRRIESEKFGDDATSGR
jgi:hypothetical protein